MKWASYIVTVYTYIGDEYSRVVNLTPEQREELDSVLYEIVSDNDDGTTDGEISKYTITDAPPMDTFSEVKDFIMEINEP